MQQPVLLFSGLVLNVILGGPRDNTLSTQTKIKSIYETGEISCWEPCAINDNLTGSKLLIDKIFEMSSFATTHNSDDNNLAHLRLCGSNESTTPITLLRADNTERIGTTYYQAHIRYNCDGIMGTEATSYNISGSKCPLPNTRKMHLAT